MIDGDAVIHEVLLPVAPEEAFEMLVGPARLVRWIGLSAELDPRPGGLFRFEVMPGQYCEGSYVVVERPRRVVLMWGALAPDARPLHDDGWPRFLARLAAAAAGHEPDPYPTGNAPAWYRNIASVESMSDPPLRIGSEVKFVARFLGRRLAYVYRVLEFVPEQRLVMSATAGPFPMETTYTWSAPTETSTLMSLRNRGDRPGS